VSGIAGKILGSSQMGGEPSAMGGEPSAILACLNSSSGFLSAFGKTFPITHFFQVCLLIFFSSPAI